MKTMIFLAVIQMSFERGQWRELITDTLALMDWDTPAAVENLIFIAAAESNGGYYLRQTIGPAVGPFQMEGDTEYTVWRFLYAQKPKHYARITEILGYHPNWHELSNDRPPDIRQRSDLTRHILIARANYLRRKPALPDPSDHWGMSEYWKKYWNTSAGAGTVRGGVDKYRRYGLGWSWARIQTMRLAGQ